MKTTSAHTLPLGAGQRCYLIAEAGVNHNGSVDRAHALVDAAVRAGADAVKFQTFKADLLVTAACPKADYQKRTTGADESQWSMLHRLELPAAAFRELQIHCREHGIEMLSTPFDEASADFLETLELPGFKVGSGDLTNHPFLAHLARKGRRLILSTGMADLDEVRAAVDVVRAHGNPPLALLHCVSQYPADPADCNLRAMATLRDAFGVPVGFSDHTLGIHVSLAAAALGAALIEKHFTLDRTLPGPDHPASLTPDDLVEWVQGVRRVEVALGDGRKVPVAAEANTAAVARRSLCAARALPAGTVLDRDMIVVRRPGTGLPPARWESLVGRQLQRAVAAGTPFAEELF